MERWRLELGGEVIATIDADLYEFPWTYGNLVESPRFERYRAYFTDDEDWPESEEFDALLNEISDKGGFRIRELSTGIVYSSVQLRQEKNVVWFRRGDPV